MSQINHVNKRKAFKASLDNKDPEIFKNYLPSLVTKINDKDNTNMIFTYDINMMIILMNWCFKYRNNFFIETRIKKCIILSLMKSYNRMKTNIFSFDTSDVFKDLSKADLKQLRFVFSRYVQIFDVLADDMSCPELTSVVNKDSIKRCIACINNKIRIIEDEPCPY